MHTVRVNRKGADRAASGHPWIFSSDVTDRGEAAPGDAVRVVDPRGRPIGVAHYSSTSQISLRLLTTAQEEIGRDFFLRRLGAAVAHRRRVVENSTARRLVFSEADLLPGLIVDQYGEYLVLQTLTQGMDRARDSIVECLVGGRTPWSAAGPPAGSCADMEWPARAPAADQGVRPPVGILARNDAGVRKLEGLAPESTVLVGTIPDRVAIEMNGLTLEADLLHGQKTGVYLDQRENYVAAARYARGRVLDCFTSTGGFALHAARNAESVEAVDSSKPALETAQVNARANNIANVEFRQADVFEYLAGLDRRFSMIVLDPPGFAKSRKAVADAARGYKEINLRALKLLEPGGVLVSCSCSHHVNEATLLQIVAEAALDCGKTLRVLERRTQASDHPILLTVPETLYLKCLILEVLQA